METSILGSVGAYRNPTVAVLGGGVGGARMARALAGHIAPTSLGVVVNVGDDDDIYGVRVCPDLDTVVSTLAGIEGTEGWGRRDDTFSVLEHLGALGFDTTFRLGDTDLATCLARTAMLGRGASLTMVTSEIARRLGVEIAVLPVTDDPVRTRVRITGGEWLDFQDYFVGRGHRDPVIAVDYAGAADAALSPTAAELITGADLVVVAPSNPVLSIGPMLAVPGLVAALGARDRVVAVSPFFGGETTKGPAADVVRSMGLPPGNRSLVHLYRGWLTDLVIDVGDAGEVDALSSEGVRVHVSPTLLTGPDGGRALVDALLGTLHG